MTQKEVDDRLEGLDNKTAARVMCALTRHGLIQTLDWGQFCCARCGEFTGNYLTHSVDQTGFVIIGHNDCLTCISNSNNLGWVDTHLTPRFTITDGK